MVVNLFLTTALLSITGSVAYILLKLLVVVSGSRLSQTWRYRSVVAVSLLFVLPLYKLWTLIPIPHKTLLPIITAGSNSGVAYLPSAPPAITELPLQVGTSNGSMVEWAQVIQWAAVLWLLVTASLILWSIWRLLCYRRLFEQASNEANSHLQQIAQEAACLAGVASEVHLLASPLVQSPMLVGFFRPTILLQSEHLPDSDAWFILAHELTHFRRGDLWKKFMVNTIQCIHWFNPIVYLLNRDFMYWLETSCDEQVVSSLDYAQRKEYGYLLINYAPASRYVGPRLYVSFTSCRYKLKRRISIMLKSNKKSRSLLGLVLAFTLIVGCLATTALAANAETVFDKPVSFESIPAGNAEFVPFTPSTMMNFVEEADVMPTAEKEVEYTTVVDLSTFSTVDPMDSSARAFDSISVDVPSGEGKLYTKALSMEAGQTININVAVSPASSDVCIGITDVDGNFRYVLATSGSVNHDFSIATRGTYYVCVVNNSSKDVSVTGFLTY